MTTPEIPEERALGEARDRWTIPCGVGDVRRVLPDAAESDPGDSLFAAHNDRKMVAAVLGAQADGHTCTLTNACDTDWLDCANALAQHKIATEHIIEPWLHTKWQSMQAGA